MNDALSLDHQGWLNGVEHVRSPNFNSRPSDCAISLLVIHNISLPPRQFGSSCVKDFFCNRLDTGLHPFFEEIKDLQVSAHCFIDRQGEITQFVGFAQRAWHAGVSEFEGRDNCNDYSIGIELEGVDDIAYTDEQYLALASVTRVLQQAYPLISAERIVGHCDIAPVRKTDPGESFDWQRFKSLL